MSHGHLTAALMCRTTGAECARSRAPCTVSRCRESWPALSTLTVQYCTVRQLTSTSELCTPRVGYSTRCGGRDVSCIYWLCGQDVDVCSIMLTVRNHTLSLGQQRFTILQVGRGLTIVRTGAWRLSRSRWRLGLVLRSRLGLVLRSQVRVSACSRCFLNQKKTGHGTHGSL